MKVFEKLKIVCRKFISIPKIQSVYFMLHLSYLYFGMFIFVVMVLNINNIADSTLKSVLFYNVISVCGLLFASASLMYVFYLEERIRKLENVAKLLEV